MAGHPIFGCPIFLEEEQSCATEVAEGPQRTQRRGSATEGAWRRKDLSEFCELPHP
jgi:hypothetical protein